MRFALALFALCVGMPFAGLVAQASPQLLLRGAEVIRSAGEAPIRADVLIENDTILEVGRDLTSASAVVRELNGQIIAPAFIDAGTPFLLDEAARRGAAGDLAAELLTSENAAGLKRMRSAGIGLACADLSPANDLRGPVTCTAITSGTSPTVKERLAGITFGLGTRLVNNAGRQSRSADAQNVQGAIAAARRYRKSIEKFEKDLKEFESKAGERAKEIEKDKTKERKIAPRRPRLEEAQECMLRVIDGALPLRIEANWREDIEAALDLATKANVKLVLLGAGEGALVSKKIADAGAIVLLPAPIRIESSPLEAPRRQAGLAATLVAAGVRVGFTTVGSRGFREDSLPLIAALHVGDGLDETSALRGLTLVAAEALGAGQRYGRVEKGRAALLQVVDKFELGGARPRCMVFGTEVVECGEGQ
jgi:imidazolonepropionase-like amidohydrolase